MLVGRRWIYVIEFQFLFNRLDVELHIYNLLLLVWVQQRIQNSGFDEWLGSLSI